MAPPKRIAIDARYLSASYSGFAKYSENLINNLSLIDQDNQYTIFTHSSFNRRLRVGDNFTVVPCRVPPLSTRTLFSFGRKVRRTRCDFLHSLSPVAPVIGARRQILTIHDMQPFTVDEDSATKQSLHNRTISLFYRFTFPHFVRQASWLISVSNATKDRLASLFPEAAHKTIVVHSGVEKQFLAPAEPTIVQMVSTKLELPKRYILYIGTAQPSKNLPAMIRAFALCLERRRDTLGDVVFLLVVGHDRRFAECERLIRSLGIEKNVRVLGPVTEEEKRVLYSRARIMYFVTRGEGFGFPLVEAQASGLPVLAGDDAAIPEVAGGSAVLVDPGDEEAIAENLSEMLLNADLRKTLTEAGRKNVERFSWETAARKMREIYELLM
ncbi:glycosyltransferase family 4 protein [Candidatus Sumerlaeota bacterium]|nr:glycosyltransferase family 4 protein [Candidatus Sumerlaeota bacterium]